MHEYLKFWKVDTAVFLRPVPAKALYLVKDLSESLERLKMLATSEPRAFMVLTGAAGTGKSTILRWLADELPITSHELLTLSLVTQEVSAGWLASRLAAAMGQRGSSLPINDNLAYIAKRMDQLTDAGKRLVVAIDSAHLLSTGEALNDIVALLNVQSLSVPCMTFLLSGELSLMDTLARVPGLLGKIALHIRIHPLDLKEAQTYMEIRLRLAGVPYKFEPSALHLIYEWSKGIMAAIDIFAEHCLIEAFKKNTHQVSLEIARSATRHLVQPHPSGFQIDIKSPDPQDSSEKKSLQDQEPSENHKSTLSSHSVSLQASDGLPSDSSTSSEEKPESDYFPEPHIPPPPSSADEKTSVAKKNSQPEGSASIRLSSLFKSVPNRPKPKGP